MELREAIEKRVLQKRKELADLDLKVRELAAYIRALEDTLRLPDNSDDLGATDGPQLRPSSEMGRARAELKKSGKPMHINEILDAIGKPDDKKSRISLTSALASYVRKGQIFTRPHPNTYGLVEFGSKERTSFAHHEPPIDFGVAVTDDDVPF